MNKCKLFGGVKNIIRNKRIGIKAKKRTVCKKICMNDVWIKAMVYEMYREKLKVIKLNCL